MNREIDEEINNIIGRSKKINKDTLLLSGGGISGIIYAGVFKALDELGILKNIKTIIGVSAGTLYSLMYLMGYTVQEIVKFAETFDSQKLTSIKNIENISIDKILLQYGVDNGDLFKKVFIKIAKQKKINPDITLLEFYNLNKIKFMIGVTNLDKMIDEYFSYESTPNIKLYDAIRATTSIPLYFTPVTINNTLYIDGGCINNFPINLFDNDLGNVVAIFINNPINTCDNKNFINYFLNVLKSMSTGWQNSLKRGYKNFIEIDSGVNSIFKFGIDDKEKKRLIKLGYDSIINHPSLMNHNQSYDYKS